jgi:hypothetical protein
MDIIDLARASGMQVILDGRIGSEIYQSVCGSVSALERFAAAVRRASEGARHEQPDQPQRTARKSRAKRSGALQGEPLAGGPIGSDSLAIRIIR